MVAVPRDVANTFEDHGDVCMEIEAGEMKSAACIIHGQPVRPYGMRGFGLTHSLDGTSLNRSPRALDRLDWTTVPHVILAEMRLHVDNYNNRQL